MKISIVVPPYEAVSQLATAASARTMSRADELAEAFRAARAPDVTIDLTIHDGALADAPPTGYLLAFRVPSSVDPQLARRIIALDEDRATVMTRVELHGFAGAVEKQRYFEWCTRRTAERGYGLVGRKEVAARASASVADGPYTSEHYGMLSSQTAHDLPGLIIEYLAAYDAAP